MAQKEAKARIKINKLLEEAGWRLLEDENGKPNVLLEVETKLKNVSDFDHGEDFEKTTHGYVDYLLCDENGYPLVVLEAKSEDKDPLYGKEQARTYADSLNARFVILSNGNLHYFWDLKRGNPEVITTFPTLESITHSKKVKPDKKKLYEEVVKDDYVAISQKPDYALDPRWQDAKQRDDYINESGIRILRPYQLQAIHTLQNSAREGNERFLFEMATGTGKTLVSAAVVKLFLKTENARRVLFLVDRIELENQAYTSFKDYLKNDYVIVIYKENRDDWRKAEIVITTVQALSFNNKFQRLFSPTDFDFIISDEAHRSIGGNSRAVFEYFVGYKLGLTATPKDYLKNLDEGEISELDPRQWERRQLLDSYITFGCESGNPTFRYSLVDGVKDGYLINPVVADARTEITTKLLSDNGYSIMVRNQEGDLEEKFYYHKDFERKFFSKKTNIEFSKVFMENALRDPITGEIGKSIIFCVSQKHAKKMAQILNQMAEVYFPGKYNSDFAMQITSEVKGAQQYTINFANNNLRGYTNFLPGYKSSKTRVCVTVGMMTTGYDCRDVMNLCLMRPIFSPTDFIQIKGRGTRKFTFKHIMKHNGEILEKVYEKEKFKLFDFFANCEYFEEKYQYDEVLKLPPETGTERKEYGKRPVTDEYITKVLDPRKFYKETQIGKEGMKIDRMFFDSFREKVKAVKFVGEFVEKGDFQSAEEIIRDIIFDKPEDYFNLPKLRKALRLDRQITLREILEYIFGYLDKFKTQEELLDEEFNKFLSIYKPDNKYVPYIRAFLKAYITDENVREVIKTKQFNFFTTYSRFSLDDFEALDQYREIIPKYIEDNVSVNAFS